MLSLSVAQYVDILMLSETKLDSTFPSTQFLINGFSVPHRLDRNSKGGSILLYVRGKIIVRGGSRTAATSKVELFVIIVNGWKPLTIITKSSTLDVVAVLNPPLIVPPLNSTLFHRILRFYFLN